MRTSLIALCILSTWLPAQSSSHVLHGSRVAIYNLVGELRVEGGAGDEVRVEVMRSGRDASRLRVESGEVRGRPALRVIYPEGRIVAPAAFGGSRSRWNSGSIARLRVDSDGTFGDGGSSWRGNTEIVARGSGIEAAADLRVIVPRGRVVELHLAVGSARITNAEGEISLDVHAASVETRGTRGRLSLDTGSGDVTVTDAEGEITLDTGSGDVHVEGVRGRSLRMDTGSGSLTARRVQVDELRLDSGSGRVELRDVQAPDLVVDTGSGSVEVELQADVERMLIDTGSGGITLGIPRSLGAELSVETGSGGIHLDLPVEAKRVTRRSLRATLGDGRGQLRVETGSGGVRIRESAGR